jgi:hypothetical protein
MFSLIEKSIISRNITVIMYNFFFFTLGKCLQLQVSCTPSCCPRFIHPCLTSMHFTMRKMMIVTGNEWLNSIGKVIWVLWHISASNSKLCELHSILSWFHFSDCSWNWDSDLAGEYLTFIKLVCLEVVLWQLGVPTSFAPAHGESYQRRRSIWWLLMTCLL